MLGLQELYRLQDRLNSASFQVYRIPYDSNLRRYAKNEKYSQLEIVLQEKLQKYI